jgi:hypothetical protein
VSEFLQFVLIVWHLFVSFGSQTTDFKKLIEAEFNKVKGTSRVSGDSQRLLRQFKEAVWVCATPIFIDDC